MDLDYCYHYYYYYYYYYYYCCCCCCCCYYYLLTCVAYLLLSLSDFPVCIPSELGKRSCWPKD